MAHKADKKKKVISADQAEHVVLPIIKSSELILSHPAIGSGAFGKVYKGSCRGKEVAVKVLDGIEWNEKVLGEFISEVEIMARLLHPNILLCMGACTEEEFGQNNYAIITEFMLRGDLNSILHSPNIHLSLSLKLKIAMDICKGMAWLVGQGILHRDMKPANVLVDQNFNCKICDFGLSQITRGKQKMRDEDVAPGSVLWMAPEVLLNETIDFKLDVYSFALVFWEILTRQDLFSEYDDKDVFTQDIAVKGVRPPLGDIEEPLKKILTQAWDREPSKRPTFEQLVTMIEKAMLEIYLPVSICSDAAKLWESNWRGESKVPFDSFKKHLFRFLKRRESAFPKQVACLKAILAQKEHDEYYVTIERFSMVLKWFGRLQVDATNNLLVQIENVLKQPWFFGDLSSNDIEDKLKIYKEGTFAIRLNLGGNNPIEKAPFTISRVDSNGKVLHTRIYIREKDGYLIQYKQGKESIKIRNKSKNIADFIKYVENVKPKIISEPCPNYPYSEIFADAPRALSAYECADDDDDVSDED